MIKTKAIKKIFITTVTMFILLTVFSIPMLEKEETLKVNVEVSENVITNNIYLLNNDSYLVQSKILLDDENVYDKVLKVLNNLIVNDNSKYSGKLRGTIPSGTKILNVFCGKEQVTIDFSKELLSVSLEDEKNMISSIVYSVLDIEPLKEVSILVEGKSLDCLPNSKEKLRNVLTKDFGINVEYNINSLEDISRVVVYYTQNIDDVLYYVPVTKYLNDDREKIKIIIEELTTSYIYEDNLMSFLNSKTKLIDYKEENDVLFLNFNEYLFEGEDRVLEEVIDAVSYSVFDSYDVGMIMFEVNGKDIKYVSRK